MAHEERSDVKKSTIKDMIHIVMNLRITSLRSTLMYLALDYSIYTRI